MKVIIFRHGEKSTFPFDDPELTGRGLRQAKHLIQVVKSGELPLPTHLEASPKKRAQATLALLASELGLPLKINHLWNEQQNGEKKNEFFNRLHQATQLISIRTNETLFVCTHMDVLDGLAEVIPIEAEKDFSFHLPTGGYLVFQIRNSQDHLVWKLIQNGFLQG